MRTFLQNWKAFKVYSRFARVVTTPQPQLRSLAKAAMVSTDTPPSRGAFIVLEGADRAGKSTQCQMLLDHFKSQGIDAELWNFPDRTTSIGTMINSYLTSKSDIDDAAVHLLFSANRWEKKQLLESKLLQGKTLIVDRYAFSGVAFTAAKQLPDLDMSWCKAPDAGLPAPDITLFLSLSPEEAASRGGYGEERYENAPFQTAVLQQFSRLREGDKTWSTIDAGGSIDEVAGRIREAAMPAVEKCKKGASIRKLWNANSNNFIA